MVQIITPLKSLGRFLDVHLQLDGKFLKILEGSTQTFSFMKMM